ncbi:MAG TPA: SAM-dependent methyltransferase [Dokdonella sp.]|uniref:SAM-dependent methyltransferase n=1 Tax=Dokdonella sp. TaxID=2291710 RepID=UPI002D7E2CA5|nr:SAM-dependent methyltransferase [Dokdonella sp.]HET9033520.1 SAM-dependent methyltransferase [Dokdonella sp.]
MAGHPVPMIVCDCDGRTGAWLRRSTLEQLIHEADRALYRAKHLGRDRVVRTTVRASAPLAGLVVVGSGIQFDRHVSERCMAEIREAQTVFCLVDPFALEVIASLRPDAINLRLHDAPGKDRRQSCGEIEESIMTELRTGKQVCAVFHGHPGVFAEIPHRVIGKARDEGFPARMEPGISAEACLYADLNIDPGHGGVQSMHAMQFLIGDRKIDPAGLLLLWHLAQSGDPSRTRERSGREGLQALVRKLLLEYPPEHEVILYEAARRPSETARADRISLGDLATEQCGECTILVIPARGGLRNDSRQGHGEEMP